MAQPPHLRSALSSVLLLLGIAKDQETTKEKKAREAAEARQQKEQDKANAYDVRQAELVIAKVQPVLMLLQALTGNNAFEMVAPPVAQPVRDAEKKYADLLEKAQAVIENGHGQLPCDAKTLASQLSDAKKCAALATNMLAVMARAVRR